MDINELLHMMVEREASDLHLRVRPTSYGAEPASPSH